MKYILEFELPDLPKRLAQELKRRQIGLQYFLTEERDRVEAYVAVGVGPEDDPEMTEAVLGLLEGFTGHIWEGREPLAAFPSLTIAEDALRQYRDRVTQQYQIPWAETGAWDLGALPMP